MTLSSSENPEIKQTFRNLGEGLSAEALSELIAVEAIAQAELEAAHETSGNAGTDEKSFGLNVDAGQLLDVSNMRVTALEKRLKKLKKRQKRD